ncbi:MAG: nucleotidyl transferase AbiEii/AbiGii toxin family protein [Gammaproteobacteria bacterium]|nr:nucleotidyl transferase AbiEii/AbiGii toxin family protein [Gammaproteobacteria bacterium]
MLSLNVSILTDETKSLFDVLAKSAELKDMTLMGGTALALQIGHRISLDFDFASFNGCIPSDDINHFVSRLKQNGFHVHEITDPQKESQFRINTGESLRDHVRDYVINDIKVTFFACGKNNPQQEFYTRAEKIQRKDMSFCIMGMDGLKTSKTLVLADRVQSRDLYDLMILMKNYNYSINDVMSVIKRIGHLDDPEYYRAVMTGGIPVDQKDPGLMPVDVDLSVTDIYKYFESQFEIYDTNKAAALYSGTDIE